MAIELIWYFMDWNPERDWNILFEKGVLLEEEKKTKMGAFHCIKLKE